ncbi:filamin-A-interacting protein 1 [Brachionichthys hirsutus]|uniref:filamin-A-interacting protein 1 n=1 Tax=Brachionichthys hirsutus TaxID=412623 RepID=UPI003604DDF6
MRSRSCTMEGPEEGRVQSGSIKQEEENKKRKMRVQRDEKDGRTPGSTKRAQNPPGGSRTALPDLSKTDLLHLLGVMEGELQAREDIISLLKSRTRPEVLEAHYGSSVPTKPLQALQRDEAGSLRSTRTEDVYQKPMAELDRLEDKQRETYRRMLDQLLLVERCHRRTVVELDTEKTKHSVFMDQSDDFTDLLEQDRERLKRLLEQEKASQARKERDHGRRLEKVRAELLKLKSFALTLVDERQLQLEQIDQQSQKLQEKERRLAAVTAGAREDGHRLLKLEAELEERANALQKSKEELQELREKIGKGECGEPSQAAELEEETTKTESRCRDMENRLRLEENHGKELRSEVDRLQRRTLELDRLQGASSRRDADCLQLRTRLEKDKRVLQDLAGELETTKSRVEELESSESRFEQAGMILKDDLVRLKSFTGRLVQDRTALAEKVQEEERRREDLTKTLRSEQGRVADLTEKLKELLKFKSETEVTVATLAREELRLKTKLASEEERSRALNTEVTDMKTRMDRLQETDRARTSDGDSGTKEPRSRLRQLEGDLMKSEHQRHLLETKFRTEQDRANALCKTLDEMRRKDQVDEAKSREVQLDIHVLKEKIHQLMNKEDQLDLLQGDDAVLQQRLTEEEKTTARAEEPESSRRYGRGPRPGGMLSVSVASTAVQTDAMDGGDAEDETAADFIRRSVLEENQFMSNLRRYPPASAESWTPWMKRTAPPKTNGFLHPPDTPVSPKPGQPLRIRVTPDHENGAATLEISSPRAEDFFSSTRIVPAPGPHKPRVSMVPKSQETAPSPDRAKSPVTIATVSRASSSDGPRSPVSLITVSRTPVSEALRPPTGRPATYRKYNITTEDNKIHIHLGPPVKGPREDRGRPASTLGLGEDTPTGTVLRSPRQPPAGQTAPSRMTSSLTITPVTSAPPRTA